MTVRTVSLVTGASRGIGAAIARALGRRGGAVAVHYGTHREAADAVCAEIRADGGEAFAVQADMGNEAQIVTMFEKADAAFGPLDCLVNNAGGIIAVKPVAEVDAATVSRVLAVNLAGPIYCCREAVRRMSTARGGRGGAILNISSMAAILGGLPHEVHYAASKGGLDSLTIGLAREVATEGIRVNAIRPGVIDTPIHAAHHGASFATDFAANLPMKRAGTAEEIAEAAVWLLSPSASYVTGAILNVSGGR
ncbi:SDR family oxidoreductase [Aestuariivirga sp.]|jgi:NAD(P)-dependent dehydrogenase (short-subunit alcohol dehydrogenase family)|uniref:SDR family oxidoreductase n=1 Tax=Aestuariivirga sp. TaxID=2650926 RepID=UPI0037841403